MTGHSPRRPRYPSDRELAWTPRQREVLSLIASGRTNPEIAAQLGISLDGAKWHVREIMAKLQVEGRDEAAAYWRARNGLGSRFVRLGAAVGLLRPATLLKFVIVGAGAAAAVAAVALSIAVLRSGNTDGGSPSAEQSPDVVAGPSLPPAAQKLADLFANGDVDGLMGRAQPTDITCNQPLDGPYPLCTGVSAGVHRPGFRVAQHGGDGEAVDAITLRQRLTDAVALGAVVTSLGCPPDSTICDQFVVAFANPAASPQRVFYIAGEAQGNDAAVVGIGSSGDNAEVFLNGGDSMTPFGVFHFIALIK